MEEIKDTPLLVLDWTLGSSPPLPAQSRTRHLWLFIYFAEWAVAAAAAGNLPTPAPCQLVGRGRTQDLVPTIH